MSDRSLGVIVQDIGDSLRDILRLEVRLAISEVREQLAAMRSGAVLAAIGLVAVIYGVGALLLAIISGLSLVMAPWLAAGLVAAVLLVMGGLLAMAGVKRLVQVPLPKKTIESVQETVHELRHEITGT